MRWSSLKLYRTLWLHAPCHILIKKNLFQFFIFIIFTSILLQAVLQSLFQIEMLLSFPKVRVICQITSHAELNCNKFDTPTVDVPCAWHRIACRRGCNCTTANSALCTYQFPLLQYPYYYYYNKKILKCLHLWLYWSIHYWHQTIYLRLIAYLVLHPMHINMFMQTVQKL